MTTMAGGGGRGEHVGFIGLGRMGYPMARNIAAGGYRTSGYDVRAEVSARFAAETGTAPVRGLADLAGCSVIITMLPRSEDVEQVLFGDGTAGLAHLLKPGTLVVDSSTGDPVITRRLGARLAESDLRMLDAPVAGGVVFAEDATLDVLIGGGEAELARIEPVLACVGKRLHRCGGLGAGHAMKLINNFVNAQALLTYAEAMTVGVKFGIDINVMIQSLREATTGRNHPFEKKMLQHVTTGRFATGMALGLIKKDVSLSAQLADSLGLWAPLMAQTAALWERAATTLGPHVDQAEVVRLWEDDAGVALRT